MPSMPSVALPRHLHNILFQTSAKPREKGNKGSFIPIQTRSRMLFEIAPSSKHLSASVQPTRKHHFPA